MSAQKKNENGNALTKVAKDFVHRLTETISENDPEKEKHFQERETAREEEVQQKLKALFKRGHGQKKPTR